MNAKEMFKKLGYDKEPFKDKNLIIYSKWNENKTLLTTIQFYNKDKIFRCFNYYILLEKHLPAESNPSEMKAIYKQMKELGWI